MKILLINPDNPANAGRDLYAGDIYSALCVFTPDRKMYFGLPLALPTLAALTPSPHVVRIVDEMVEPINFNEDCDLVGITAMTFKAPRAYEIAIEFQKRGVPVIMGGIHASMCPSEAALHVDSVVVGEADELWPQILADFENGNLQARYQVSSAPDITQNPPPRHDLSSYDKYLIYFLQTTRGCPFSCKFCTVTAFNGKLVRKKTSDQVISEVEQIIKLQTSPLVVMDQEDGGKRKKIYRPLFITDDNFAIERDHALAICKALKKYQSEKKISLTWFTQVNYKVGFDDELLAAMKGAGCRQLFMGFESLGEESLKAMKKTMNSPERYAESIKNVKRYGMEVVFSTILGGEFDTCQVGDDLARFIEDNNVFYVLPNILTPYPGTALAAEMEKAGRIINRKPGDYNIRNVVFQPARMTPLELQSVFTDFCGRIFDIANMIKRAKATLRNPQRYVLPPYMRFAVWLLFSLTVIRLAYRGKIKLQPLMQTLLAAPSMIVMNGSLAALGMLATSVDYDDFARSEKIRLPHSPAAQVPSSAPECTKS